LTLPSIDKIVGQGRSVERTTEHHDYKPTALSFLVDVGSGGLN
jgi:hypothetical protein